MGKLIKMDTYRLIQSKLFWILGGTLFAINFLMAFGLPFLYEVMENMSDDPDAFKISKEISFSGIVSDPVSGFMLILMFVSATAFLYADIRNGYIKNIAGQLPKKGQTAISKFVVAILHNCIFMVLGFLGSYIGYLACPKMTVVYDNKLASGLVVLLLRLILSMSMVAIILFITTGLRNKTLASVVGVMFSVGALGLLYTGINKLIEIAGLREFDVTDYIPDQLYGKRFDLAAANSVISAAIVGVIFCVVFLALTVAVFNKRDVK